MKQTVFIASLGHSGSTLLSLILGGHSRMVGLGEIARVLLPGPMGLEKTRQGLCSCNQDLDHCIFWGKVAGALEANEEASIDRKYKVVFDTCREVFGGDAIPVDSSKYLNPLQTVHRQLNGELKVIFLLKDVRTYTVSQLERAKRKNLNFRNRVAAYHFLQWYRRNQAVKKHLQQTRIPYFQISYEELCLYPVPTMERVCDFLGESYEPEMLSLSDSGSHVIRGNRMKNQTGKRKAISYDHRWFCRKELNRWCMLLPWIMRFNDREVYRNGSIGKWDD